MQRPFAAAGRCIEAAHPPRLGRLQCGTAIAPSRCRRCRHLLACLCTLFAAATSRLPRGAEAATSRWSHPGAPLLHSGKQRAAVVAMAASEATMVTPGLEDRVCWPDQAQRRRTAADVLAVLQGRAVQDATWVGLGGLSDVCHSAICWSCSWLVPMPALSPFQTQLDSPDHNCPAARLKRRSRFATASQRGPPVPAVRHAFCRQAGGAVAPGDDTPAWSAGSAGCLAPALQAHSVGRWRRCRACAGVAAAPGA